MMKFVPSLEQLESRIQPRASLISKLYPPPPPLIYPAAVTGQVKDNFNNLLPGVGVFSDINNDGNWDPGENVGRTDSLGNFLIPDLTPNTSHNIRVELPTNYTTFVPVLQLYLYSGERKDFANFVLTRPFDPLTTIKQVQSRLPPVYNIWNASTTTFALVNSFSEVPELAGFDLTGAKGLTVPHYGNNGLIVNTTIYFLSSALTTEEGTISIASHELFHDLDGRHQAVFGYTISSTAQWHTLSLQVGNTSFVESFPIYSDQYWKGFHQTLSPDMLSYFSQLYGPNPN